MRVMPSALPREQISRTETKGYEAARDTWHRAFLLLPVLSRGEAVGGEQRA